MSGGRRSLFPLSSHRLPRRRAAGDTQPLGPSNATARLTIRPAVAEDLAALHSLWSDTRKFLFDDQHVSLDLAKSVLDSSLLSATDGIGLWVAESQGNTFSLLPKS
jgi:hypothetical protein